MSKEFKFADVGICFTNTSLERIFFFFPEGGGTLSFL